jgi:hypothetical protein
MTPATYDVDCVLRIQSRSLRRKCPLATLRPALMTSHVVVAANIASAIIKASMTNSDGQIM